MNNRKITALFFNLVLALALAITTLPSQAAVPQTLNYQGQLASAAGVPVNSGLAGIGMTFKLYDAATAGNLLWSETRNVVVSNGLYSVTLGAITPLTPAMFGVPLYLGIAVGADAEMTPRIALSSSATALRAGLADVAGSVNCTGCLTTSNIAPGAVSAGNIAAGSISSSLLASGSVTAAKLAAGAVTTSAISAGAITAAKLAPGTVMTSWTDGTGKVTTLAKVGVGTAAPAGDLHTSGQNGVLLAGTFDAAGVTPLPASGAGTRLMWLPEKAAFRVGAVYATQWDAASIGLYSTALGRDTTASGLSSTALGSYTAASGSSSTALGTITAASGNYSTALGYGTTASGSGSSALGINTAASGNYSTALGYVTTASGNYSTALGTSTTASGEVSTALGYGTTAPSYGETAVGMYNTVYTPLGTTHWNAADRLFTIGNGNPNALTYSNALVVLKNGNTGIGTSAPVVNARLDVQGGAINIGGTGNADAALHIKSSFGGLDRLTQIHPTAASKPGLNLMASTNSAAATQWWVWGPDTGNVWRIQPGTGFSGSTGLFIDNTGNVGIGTLSPTANLSVNGTANNTTGVWSVFSDERLKDIGGHYDAGLDALMQLQPVTYHYKKDNPLKLPNQPAHIGFSAQALQKVIPEAVSMTGSGYLEVDSGPVYWTMLNAIKDLKRQKDSEMSAKNAEIAALKQELATQRETLAAIKAEQVEKMAALATKDEIVALKEENAKQKDRLARMESQVQLLLAQAQAGEKLASR